MASENIIEYVIKIKNKEAAKVLKTIAKDANVANVDLSKLGKGFDGVTKSATASATGMSKMGQKGSKSIGSIKSSLTPLKAAFDQLAGSVLKVAAVFADVTQEIYRFTKANVDAINEINDLANKTGISSEVLAGISMAFQSSGQSAQAAVGMMEAFPRQLKLIQKEGSEANKKMKELGIPIEGTNEEILINIVNHLQSLDNASQRANDATLLLGRSAKGLLQAFAGSASIEEFSHFTEQFGVNAKEGADRAAEFQRVLSGLKVVLEGAIDKIVVATGATEAFQNMFFKIIYVAVFTGEAITQFAGTIKTVQNVIFALITNGIKPLILALMGMGGILGGAAMTGFNLFLKGINKVRAALGLGSATINQWGTKLDIAAATAEDAVAKIKNLAKAKKDDNEEDEKGKKKKKKAKDAQDEQTKAMEKAAKEAEKLAKAKERLSEKLKDLILKFKDGDISIDQAAKSTRGLKREFNKLGMSLKPIEDFDWDLFSASFDKMAKDFENTMGKIDMSGVVDEALRVAKEIEDLMPVIKVQIGLGIVKNIADLANLQGEIIGSLLEKGIAAGLSLIGKPASGAAGLAGSVIGAAGSLADVGSRMKTVGNEALETEREDRIAAAIAQAERGGRSLTAERKSQIEAEAGFLTAKEQRQIVHDARMADAQQRVRDFTDSIAIGIEMLPAILIEALPPAIINGTIRIVEAIFNLPERIGNSIKRFFKRQFGGLKNEFIRLGEIILNALSLGTYELFKGDKSKASGGRLISAASGMRYTGQAQESLALVHSGEYIVPASGSKPQSVDREMQRQAGSGININITGQVIEGNAIDRLVREIEQRFQNFGTSKSSLFGG